MQIGDYEHALQHVDQGLAGCTQLRNDRLLGILLINRVICLTELGRASDARPDVAAVLAMPTDASGRGSIEPAFEALAISALRAGDLARGAELVARARQPGLLLNAVGPRRLRAVTHLDVDGAACARAAEIVAAVAGAADRHGEVAALVGRERGQPARQEGLDLPQHLRRFGLRLQVGDDVGVAPRQRPQLADVVGVGQHAHVEDEVRVQRHAVLEREALEHQRQSVAVGAHQVAHPGAQLGRAQLAGVHPARAALSGRPCASHLAPGAARREGPQSPA